MYGQPKPIGKELVEVVQHGMLNPLNKYNAKYDLSNRYVSHLQAMTLSECLLDCDWC